MVETLPRLEERHLNHVPSFGIIGENSGHCPVEAAGMAPNQLSERFLIAVLRTANPVAVRSAGKMHRFSLTIVPHEVYGTPPTAVGAIAVDRSTASGLLF